MEKSTRVLTRDDASNWVTHSRKLLMAYWKHSDKDILITIEEVIDNRKSAQNRLLWLWNGELANHIFDSTGDRFSSDDVHEHVVDMLLPKHVVQINGNPIVVRSKTSKLKVKDFAAFLTEYFAWADIKYGLELTRPEDLYLRAVMKDEK